MTLHPGPGKPGAFPPESTKHVVRSKTTVLSTTATEAKWLHPPQLRSQGSGGRRSGGRQQCCEHTDLGARVRWFEPRLGHRKLYDLEQAD